MSELLVRTIDSDFQRNRNPRVRSDADWYNQEFATGPGKGAWRDNVFVERLWRSIKYEEIYLRAYDTVARLGPRSVGT